MKKIAISLIVLALCCSSYARKVSGSVTCGETKLEGVIVTDGEHFTLTGKNGKFKFDISDSAEFVYIVTPSGYIADWSTGVPAFYQKAEGCDKFDFSLQKLSGEKDYHIVAIADTQTYSDEHMEQFSGRPIEDLCKTAKDLNYQAVGLTLGDICWDNTAMLSKYKEQIARTGIPFYPVIGNHDHEAFREGDSESAATYRSILGPENYAFYIGQDVVIVLDNIIYDTNFKSRMGYTEEVIKWVRELERMIPENASLYIAQHVPFCGGRSRLYNANQLLDIIRGHKVTFLSGHTHENNNYQIERNIIEHNVAAICGAWWDTEYCTDGTPRGYKVYTKESGKLSWYYKAVDHEKDFILQSYGLGETIRHPNAIVLNVWDWDPEWKVEWYEDGIFRGSMDPIEEISPDYSKGITQAYARYGEEIPGWKKPNISGHFFAAMPDRYANKVTVSVTGRFGQVWVKTFDISNYKEVTAECTSAEEAITKVENGVNMLKMTLYPGADGQVVVASKQGQTLKSVLDAVEAYTEKNGYSPVRYHLEITSTERYYDFIDACMQELWPRFLEDRLLLTCPKGIQEKFLKERFPEVYLTK